MKKNNIFAKGKDLSIFFSILVLGYILFFSDQPKINKLVIIVILVAVVIIGFFVRRISK